MGYSNQSLAGHQVLPEYRENTVAGFQQEEARAEDLAELSVRLPGGPLHTWRWNVPRVRPTRIAFALVALHVALTATRLARSWWWQDDLYMFGLVADRNLTPGLLFSDYNGHLEPGSFLMAWLVTHIVPFAWWPAAVTQLILMAAIDLAFLALLVRMFGRRPAILVPLAMWCATSVTLTGTLWWSAAMQWLPTTLCLVLCVYFHVGFLTTGARRQALGAILSLVGGLFFFEKALTALAVLAFLTLAYYTPGPVMRRPIRAFTQHRTYWTTFSVLTIGYLLLYVTRTTVTPSESGGADRIVDLAGEGVLQNYLPGMFGGPLRWGAMPDQVAGWPNPAAPVVWISAALGIALVVGSLLARSTRRAKRFTSGAPLGGRSPLAAWVLLALFIAVTLGLLARTRLGMIGPFIGRDHRYLTDAALLGPLCLALAWLPLRSTAPAAGPAAGASEHPTARHSLVHGVEADAEPPASRNWGRVATGTVFVLVITICGVISGERYMQIWSRNPSEKYIANLRHDLDAAKGTVTMFDQAVPTSMMMSSFEEGAKLSHVTKPLPKQPQFVTWATTVKVADAEGKLRDGKVTGVTAPGKRLVCNRGRATSVTRKLPVSPIKWDWKVQIAYVANRETTAVVTVHDGRRPAAEAIPVKLTPGMRVLYVALLGGGDRVTVSGLKGGASVCLAQVSVGELVPTSPAQPAE